MWITFALPRWPVQYIDQSIWWHHVKAVRSYVWIEYELAVWAVDNHEPAKTVKQFMEEEWWIAAINWSFFCPNESAYSRCEQWTTDKMRITDYNTYAKRWWDMPENDMTFWYHWSDWLYWFDNWSRYREVNPDWTQWWNNYWIHTMTAGIQMPSLIENWVVTSHLNDEMNNDAKQSRAATKQFICGIDTREVMFWSVSNITFHDLGYYLKDNFGCDYAILLDWWWSSALHAEWEYKRWPWRKVMDAFVLVPRSAGQIAPYNTNFTQPPLPPEPIITQPTISYPFWDIDTPVTDAMLFLLHRDLFETIDTRLKEERSTTRLAIYRNFIGYARDIDQDDVAPADGESTWRVITLARFMNEVLNSN